MRNSPAVLPRPGERLAHDLDLGGERRGRRGSCAEEAVAQPCGAPQRGRPGSAEPDRRAGFLGRLGLHRHVLELPELPVEGDARLGPQRLHQREALGEPRDVPAGIHAEGGERPGRAAGPHSDLDPAAAELVQGAQALRQVYRAVQGRHEYHASQPQPPAARGGVGHGLDRPEHGGRAQHVFLRPCTVEAQFLDAGEVSAEGRRVELSVAVQLGDRDRKAHTAHASRA